VSVYSFYLLSPEGEFLLTKDVSSNSNIITVNLMEAVGEAQVFAEKTGLGTGAMEELIGEAFGPVAGGYSKRYCIASYLQMHQPALGIIILTFNAA
jgi:hypothetical protein